MLSFIVVIIVLVDNLIIIINTFVCKLIFKNKYVSKYNHITLFVKIMDKLYIYQSSIQQVQQSHHQSDTICRQQCHLHIERINIPSIAAQNRLPIIIAIYLTKSMRIIWNFSNWIQHPQRILQTGKQEKATAKSPFGETRRYIAEPPAWHICEHKCIYWQRKWDSHQKVVSCFIYCPLIFVSFAKGRSFAITSYIYLFYLLHLFPESNMRLGLRKSCTTIHQYYIVAKLTWPVYIWTWTVYSEYSYIQTHYTCWCSCRERQQSRFDHTQFVLVATTCRRSISH